MTDDQAIGGGEDETLPEKFTKIPIKLMGGSEIIYYVEETELGATITDREGDPLVRLSVKGAAFVGGVLQQIAAHHEHAEDT